MGLVIYKSSAGSGKTSTLTFEYLRLALAHEQASVFNRILAITFTNKAAQEMKSRIRESLAHFALNDPFSGKQGYLGRNLCEALDITPEVLQERSASLLRTMLHQYADLSVSTIDSFMHRIVRTFAYDFSLPYQFEVELEEEELLAKAIDALFERIGKDEEVTEILVQFLWEQLNSERSLRIERELLRVAKALLQDRNRHYLAATEHWSLPDFSKLIERLQAYAPSIRDSIQKLASEALEQCVNQGLSVDSFAGKSKSIFGWLEKTAAQEWTAWKTYAWMAKDPVEWSNSKASEAERSTLEGLISKLTQTVAHIREQSSILTLLSLAGKRIYQQAVLNEINREVHRIKTEQNLVHISDFSPLIAQITATEPVPFIYERLGERYFHYFIDEFQDTSHLQWINVLPLLENSLAQDYTNLLVGDGKQIIYRWRGSEVEQFMYLPQLYNPRELPALAQRAGLIQREADVRNLTSNYRSKYEVVDFNNRFFDQLKTSLAENLQPVYDHHTQEGKRSDTGGYVSLQVVPAARAEEQEVTLRNYLNEKLLKLWEAGYVHSDVCVLVRKKEEAKHVAHWLQEDGYHVYSNESLLIQSSPRVHACTCLLHWLAQPEELYYQVALVTALQQIGWISEIPHGKLIRWKGAPERFTAWLSEIQLEVDPIAASSLPLTELLEFMLRLFGWTNETADAYVLAFGNLVLEFEQRQGNDLHAFLTWWESQRDKAALDVPPERNAIQLLTIHKSKGLEFPIVIMPYGCWDLGNHSQDMWLPLQYRDIDLPAALIPENKALQETSFREDYEREKQLQWLDNVNLYYVAFTRAAERLYVYLPQPLRSGNHTFAEVARSLSALPEFDAETGRLALGSEYDRAPEATTTETTPEAMSLVSEAWSTKLQVAVSSRQPHADADFGHWIHGLLHRAYTLRDLEQTIIPRLELTENAEYRRRGLAIVEAMLQDTQLQKLFSPDTNSWNEWEITDEQGRLLRLDRLVRTPDGTYTLLDYKTADRQADHVHQIQRYGRCVQHATGSTPTLILVYLEPLTLVTVPFDLHLFTT